MLFNLCAYWNEKKRGSFQKNNNLLLYAIQLVCIVKWNKRESFQKTPIYYSVLFNLCAYWNETRGKVFKKNNNILPYVIQLVCVLKWNKRDSFQKNTIYYSMLFNLCAYATELLCDMKGQFSKKSKQFITVCFSTSVVPIEMKQLGLFSKKQQKKQFITVCYSTCVCIEMKQEGQFSKKTTIYYRMLFNLCAYWNETRGAVFKKK